MAIQQRQPAPGLIVHSDCGSQYASALYQDLLTEHGFVCSMGCRGNCWNNAVAGRFFLNLKIERLWQRQYANHAEARADITDYIVGFYYCKRINSALGNLSPAVYERKNSSTRTYRCVRNYLTIAQCVCWNQRSPTTVTSSRGFVNTSRTAGRELSREKYLCN